MSIHNPPEASNPEDRDTVIFPGMPGEDMGAFVINTPTHLVSITFIKAQGEFIRCMTYFLEEGRNTSDDKAYIDHLTAYAKAQNNMIAAQQDYMRALGVL